MKFFKKLVSNIGIEEERKEISEFIKDLLFLVEKQQNEFEFDDKDILNNKIGEYEDRISQMKFDLKHIKEKNIEKDLKIQNLENINMEMGKEMEQLSNVLTQSMEEKVVYFENEMKFQKSKYEKKIKDFQNEILKLKDNLKIKVKNERIVNRKREDSDILQEGLLISQKFEKKIKEEKSKFLKEKHNSQRNLLKMENSYITEKMQKDSLEERLKNLKKEKKQIQKNKNEMEVKLNKTISHLRKMLSDVQSKIALEEKIMSPPIEKNPIFEENELENLDKNFYKVQSNNEILLKNYEKLHLKYDQLQNKFIIKKEELEEQIKLLNEEVLRLRKQNQSFCFEEKSNYLKSQNEITLSTLTPSKIGKTKISQKFLEKMLELEKKNLILEKENDILNKKDLKDLDFYKMQIEILYSTIFCSYLKSFE